MASPHLSRADMEMIVKRNESVLWDGKLISDVNMLPTEADIALKTGNFDPSSTNEDDLDAQIKTLEERKKALAEARKSAEKKAEEDQKAAEEAEAVREDMAAETEKAQKAQAAEAAKAEKK